VTERLYRHPTDRVIAGVAGGLATWLNIDPSLVRVAWVLLAVFSGGLFALAYVVMMIVVPLPPPGWIPRPRNAGDPGFGAAPGPGALPGWQPGGPPAGPAGAAGAAGAPGGPPPGPASAQAPMGTSTPPPAWRPIPPTAAWRGPGAGSAGIVTGAVLIALGLWFLVDQFVSFDWDLLWPVVVMVLGGALIARTLMRRPPAA
jgi:phage shock protein C